MQALSVRGAGVTRIPVKRERDSDREGSWCPRQFQTGQTITTHASLLSAAAQLRVMPSRLPGALRGALTSAELPIRAWRHPRAGGHCSQEACPARSPPSSVTSHQLSSLLCSPGNSLVSLGKRVTTEWFLPSLSLYVPILKMGAVSVNVWGSQGCGEFLALTPSQDALGIWSAPGSPPHRHSPAPTSHAVPCKSRKWRFSHVLAFQGPRHLLGMAPARRAGLALNDSWNQLQRPRSPSKAGAQGSHWDGFWSLS